MSSFIGRGGGSVGSLAWPSWRTKHLSQLNSEDGYLVGSRNKGLVFVVTGYRDHMVKGVAKPQPTTTSTLRDNPEAAVLPKLRFVRVIEDDIIDAAMDVFMHESRKVGDIHLVHPVGTPTSKKITVDKDHWPTANKGKGKHTGVALLAANTTSRICTAEDYVANIRMENYVNALANMVQCAFFTFADLMAGGCTDEVRLREVLYACVALAFNVKTYDERCPVVHDTLEQYLNISGTRDMGMSLPFQFMFGKGGDARKAADLALILQRQNRRDKGTIDVSSFVGLDNTVLLPSVIRKLLDRGEPVTEGEVWALYDSALRAVQEAKLTALSELTAAVEDIHQRRNRWKATHTRGTEVPASFKDEEDVVWKRANLAVVNKICEVAGLLDRATVTWVVEWAMENRKGVFKYSDMQRSLGREVEPMPVAVTDCVGTPNGINAIHVEKLGANGVVVRSASDPKHWWGFVVPVGRHRVKIYKNSGVAALKPGAPTKGAAALNARICGGIVMGKGEGMPATHTIDGYGVLGKQFKGGKFAGDCLPLNKSWTTQASKLCYEVVIAREDASAPARILDKNGILWYELDTPVVSVGLSYASHVEVINEAKAGEEAAGGAGGVAYSTHAVAHEEEARRAALAAAVREAAARERFERRTARAAAREEEEEEAAPLSVQAKRRLRKAQKKARKQAAAHARRGVPEPVAATSAGAARLTSAYARLDAAAEDTSIAESSARAAREEAEAARIAAEEAESEARLAAAREKAAARDVAAHELMTSRAAPAAPAPVLAEASRRQQMLASVGASLRRGRRR